jgi:hypothetical protein
VKAKAFGGRKIDEAVYGKIRNHRALQRKYIDTSMNKHVSRSYISKKSFEELRTRLGDFSDFESRREQFSVLFIVIGLFGLILSCPLVFVSILIFQVQDYFLWGMIIPGLLCLLILGTIIAPKLTISTRAMWITGLVVTVLTSIHFYQTRDLLYIKAWGSYVWAHVFVSYSYRVDAGEINSKLSRRFLTAIATAIAFISLFLSLVCYTLAATNVHFPLARTIVNSPLINILFLAYIVLSNAFSKKVNSNSQ